MTMPAPLIPPASWPGVPPGGPDYSDMIPEEFAARILQQATETSLALRLGTRIPMGTRVSTMPVPKTFPKAAFISTGGRKPYTDLSLDTMSMTAEEIAAVISIGDAMADDAAVDLWGYSVPRLAEALAIALDAAILFGVGAPATFPSGGVQGAATAATVGSDVIDTVNNAMGAVEAQGLAISGSAADTRVRAKLRGVRDTTGALLLGPGAATAAGAGDTLWGVPIGFGPFESVAGSDFITGDWSNLLIGVRQDIRMEMSSTGVLVDENGKVIISAFQDNVTLLKIWARFACAIVKPVTSHIPTGAVPFAKATLAA